MPPLLEVSPSPSSVTPVVVPNETFTSMLVSGSWSCRPVVNCPAQSVCRMRPTWYLRRGRHAEIAHQHFGLGRGGQGERAGEGEQRRGGERPGGADEAAPRDSRRAGPACRPAADAADVEGEEPPPRRGGRRSGGDDGSDCSRARGAVMASALGARRSALGARRSALGARRSALGARRSALGARRSALGARRSALGARRSALGARRSALGARRSALGALN